MSKNNRLNENYTELDDQDNIEVINVSRREGNSDNMRRPPNGGSSGDVRRSPNGGSSGNVRRPSNGESSGNVRRSPNGGSSGNVRRPPNGESSGNVRRPPNGGSSGNMRRPPNGGRIPGSGTSGDTGRSPDRTNSGKGAGVRRTGGQENRKSAGPSENVVSTGGPRIIQNPMSRERPIPVNNRKLERRPPEQRNPERRPSERRNTERRMEGQYSDRRNLNRINYEKRNPRRRNSGKRSGRNGRGTGMLAGLLILLILVGAGLTGGYFYVRSLAYKVVRAEAGVSISPSDFLKKPDETAVFAEGSDPFDITKPGEYQVRIKSGFFTHKCTLIIEDKVAPTGTPVQVTIPMGTVCGPESFVSNIQDVTDVTVSFVAEPDFSRKGSQTVQIALTDEGNNRTILDAELYLSIVADQVTVEAGTGIPGLEKFVAAGETGQFVTNISVFDYTKVGDHAVDLLVNGENYTSIMHVVDTVPPAVEVHDIEDFVFVPKSAMDFASEIQDVTEVTASFKKEPDLSRVGTQEVELVYTDAGNNRTEKKAKLTLKEDKEAPVIHGAVDLVIYAGDSVSYKKDITVTDNAASGLTLEVDTSKVNTKAEGIYPVTYIASDAAGNTTTATVNLTVKPRLYDIDEVNALGDSIIARIITEDMTELDKVEAIYTYIMGHVGYINDSEKEDWVQAAYEGLMNRQGDCYVYASVAKLLLTRAGIKNMDIEKIPSNTLHYWNLVDIGDGWYHFDTTPRKDHPRIFMWDDQQMMDYSETHDKSHNYDHSLYPKVNGSTQEGLPEESSSDGE